MDILRKALQNPKSVTFNPLKINNLDLPAPININFLSKKYSDTQILFYIVNHPLSYKEYLTCCKDQNILPISYLDQKKLLESLKTEEYIQFNNLERHNCTYDYSFIKDYSIKSSIYSIIVSSAQNSLLNLKNVKDFLTKGVFRRKLIPFDEVENPVRFGKKYLVVDSFKSKSSKLVAVFLDGNDWQLKNCEFDGLQDLCKKVAVFYVSEDTNDFKKYGQFDVTCIKVENNKRISVEMFRSLWGKIVAFEKKV